LFLQKNAYICDVKFFITFCNILYTTMRSTTVFLAFAFLTSSCIITPTPTNPPSITKNGNVTTVKNLDASSEDRFTFFSLRDGVLRSSADSASDTWDIGVRKTSIIVNGGSIRAGKGAGLRLTNQAFESLRAIPTSGFRTDESEENLAFTPRTGQSWYSYDATVINPIKDVTLLIRTGNGQAIAKVQIQSYYKDAVAPDPFAPTRFYTFRYQIANSTTQSFE
jgi:hypothetical protein